MVFHEELEPPIIAAMQSLKKLACKLPARLVKLSLALHTAALYKYTRTPAYARCSSKNHHPQSKMKRTKTVTPHPPSSGPALRY
jgi:hypothetical protein